MKKFLWGDYFYDPSRKKWVTSAKTEDGRSLQRGFCQFVIEPIYKLFMAIIDGDSQRYDKMLSVLHIVLSSEERVVYFIVFCFLIIVRH